MPGDHRVSAAPGWPIAAPALVGAQPWGQHGSGDRSPTADGEGTAPRALHQAEEVPQTTRINGTWT